MLQLTSKPLLMVSMVVSLAACGKKSADDQSSSTPEPAAGAEAMGGGGGAAGEGKAQPRVEPATPAAPQVLPEKHYKELSPLFKSIVGGQLDKAKQVAAALPVYTAREGGQKKVWAEQLAAIGVAAEKGAKAESLADAGLALGGMLAQCDACHTMESELKIEIPPPKEPAKGDVKRHGWAAIRMFLGLVGNDLVGFSQGAQELESAPFYDEKSKAELGEAELALVKSIRTFALEANEILAAERAQLFGEMIGECSGCHTKLMEAR